MTALLYGIIQTTAYNNRFELGPNQPTDEVAVFASVHHPNQVAIADDGENFMFRGSRNQAGLAAAFSQFAAEDCLSVPHAPNDVTDHLELIGKMFTAAAELPPDPGEPATPITESIARVKTRLGQHLYKTKQLALWDNACAVTGITDRALLRASHAKPWHDPTITDAERLDPANGFPLAVHLDALFDQGLITFADDGSMLLSPQLSSTAIELYNLSSDLHLRRQLTDKQLAYLTYHRKNVYQNDSIGGVGS